MNLMAICAPFVDTTYGRIAVFSSGARPTGVDRWEGRVIYEDDTDRILFWNLTGWVILQEPAQSYTPTLTGITIGSPGQDITFRYHRSDGYCEINGSFTLGTGGVATGLVGISVPTGTDLIAVNYGLVGQAALIRDVSAPASFPAFIQPGTVTRLDLYTANAASAAAAATIATSATSPMNPWAVGDNVTVHARWQMANRHSF